LKPDFAAFVNAAATSRSDFEFGIFLTGQVVHSIPLFSSLLYLEAYPADPHDLQSCGWRSPGVMTAKPLPSHLRLNGNLTSLFGTGRLLTDYNGQPQSLVAHKSYS